MNVGAEIVTAPPADELFARPLPIVSVFEPPTETGVCTDVSNVRLLMMVGPSMMVLRLAATGLVVTKCTSVVLPGGENVSTPLVALVRQLVALPASCVFQLASMAPDQ